MSPYSDLFDEEYPRVEPPARGDGEDVPFDCAGVSWRKTSRQRISGRTWWTGRSFAKAALPCVRFAASFLDDEKPRGVWSRVFAIDSGRSAVG